MVSVIATAEPVVPDSSYNWSQCL